MQVANALNNTIRILFNPKVEAFRLFDFLIVQSNQDRYLAQIIEIYDDKYDASQNVAKLKLYYKITPNNEVIPYDNFTPNKECEIIKVKQEEIEGFINQDKKTFIFGTNVKNSMSLNIQYDFFNNNPIILADKIENSNAISVNLAKNLSSKRNAVIVDFTGSIEFEDAKKIFACKNFKMPLNYDTLDYVFERCLRDSSLEFQAIGFEIMNEIKKFAKNQEDGYIPFTAFVKVLSAQYKATPYSELKLFASRIKRLQMDDIFVKTKRESEALEKTIQKNLITILDLSHLSAFWQKAYFEYIASSIQENVYLIARVNDENFDVNLIHKIYNEKKNIKFIPNVSYNYSKLPSIVQYCKNYILMPSLNQRNDFLDANFALCNLISDGCIIFGKNTDNFLYLAKDYELEVQEKRKNYRKINLTDAYDEEQYNNTNIQNQGLLQELESNIASLEMQKENEENEAKEEDDFFLDAAEQMSNTEEQNQEEQPQEVQEEETSFETGQIFANSDENNVSEPAEAEPVEETEADKEQNLSDEELDFFPTEEISEENVVIDDIEYKVQSDDEEDEVDSKNSSEAPEEVQEVQQEETQETEEVQEVEQVPEVVPQEVEEIQEEVQQEAQETEEVNDTSIENNFEEVLNSSVSGTVSSNVEVEENVLIPIDVPQNEEIQQESLPVFNESIPATPQSPSSSDDFEVGDSVVHDKYGKGNIVKIIQYDQRQLLQIKFEESGKKLLDPKVASINKL